MKQIENEKKEGRYRPKPDAPSYPPNALKYENPYGEATALLSQINNALWTRPVIEVPNLRSDRGTQSGFMNLGRKMMLTKP